MEKFSDLTPDKMNGDHQLCPVLDNPEPDCYCLNLNSQAISLAVRFCIRNFRECPIYKRWMGLQPSWSSNAGIQARIGKDAYKKILKRKEVESWKTSGEDRSVLASPGGESIADGPATETP